MKNLETAIREAMKEYYLEEGDEIVIAYNNCSISLSRDFNGFQWTSKSECCFR